MRALIVSFLVLGMMVGGAASAGAGDYMSSPYSDQGFQRHRCPPGWEAAFPEEARREPSGEAILFDAIVLRPLGLAATAIGTAGAVLTAPWAANTCEWDLVERKLIREPADYTFCRPLGDIDY